MIFKPKSHKEISELIITFSGKDKDILQNAYYKNKSLFIEMLWLKDGFNYDFSFKHTINQLNMGKNGTCEVWFYKLSQAKNFIKILSPFVKNLYTKKFTNELSFFNGMYYVKKRI